jgi:4-hydroxy-3-methylbut-2-enyl diphosphate reductase
MRMSSTRCKKKVLYLSAILKMFRKVLFVIQCYGVGPEQWDEAKERHLKVIDATCPLVDRVHRSAKKYAEQGLR